MTMRFMPSMTSAPTMAAPWLKGSSRGVRFAVPGTARGSTSGRAGRLSFPAIEPVTAHQVEVRGDEIFVALDED